jgi:MFS family permease
MVTVENVPFVAAWSSLRDHLLRNHHLRTALRTPGFRRLFAVRLSAQFGDGVFQASLAGAVLFSPERQAHASDVAIGFAVLLLPYSVIGPFAGVLLDRWWRQRVLVLTNVVRVFGVLGIAAEITGDVHGEPFYASALVVLSLSRFFLSGLSASLPHVVSPAELVTANALSTTLGAIATTAGGGVALIVNWATAMDRQGGYAVMAAAAVVPYLVSAVAARGFRLDALGPDDVERANRETLAEIARGLVAGARHLHGRPPAFLAMAAIGVHRLCYGLFAVCSVLLFRNYYSADGVFRTGLAGLGTLLAVIAVGGGVAALLTPAAARRFGYATWIATLLFASGIVQVGLVLPYQLPLHLVAGLGLGFGAQGIKICVDTVVQRGVDDEFRGRVFALYDTVFNLALVAAAVLTAIALPDNGHAPLSVVLIGAAYVVTAVLYLHRTRREEAAAHLRPAATPTSA